ncbi:hypothetical protein DL546_004673 [Coniochaeta pulveracea]|uniref:Uncharacterized protein n=1 Tax=Coniochaeta pulveracea TaxID=177199 RepID=A0A420Y0Y3_9PEZI|nr:hypothetical protein DL546_004673 [Coniochaeta pulveracea]
MSEGERRVSTLEAQYAELRSQFEAQLSHETINKNHSKLKTRVQQVENLLRKTIKRFDGRKSREELDENNN